MSEKPTIGNIQAIALVAIAIIFDLVKALFFFLVVIPGIGAAIDLIGSPIISILEDGVEFVILWFSGAYKNGGASNIRLMAATFVAGLTPFIEDFPLTTMTVIWTIWKSRQSDKKRFVHDQSARASQIQKQQQEQEFRNQAAQQAAVRADAQRAQAMQISRAAANDNTPAADAARAA